MLMVSSQNGSFQPTNFVVAKNLLDFRGDVVLKQIDRLSEHRFKDKLRSWDEFRSASDDKIPTVQGLVLFLINCSRTGHGSLSPSSLVMALSQDESSVSLRFGKSLAGQTILTFPAAVELL